MHLSNQQKQIYLDKLFEFLRIKSISALPEHKADVLKAADFIRGYLVESGFESKKIEFLYGEDHDETSSNPVIYAEKVVNSSLPTILIYGHYDVQPVDPINEWKSEPFEPTIRDGKIFARGATDDKGQLFTHLAALNELSKSGEFPCNIKLLIEGEEEMGGENIASIVSNSKFKAKLACDICLISDTAFIDKNKPAIEYGLRGIVYAQLNVTLGERDLHSGLFGGGILNPIQALTKILDSLKDLKNGKILIPGIYDDVLALDQNEKDRIQKMATTDENFLKDAGNAKAIFGEQGFNTAERTSARPALDINGIWGGWSGDGAKTVIPRSAHAKLSIRTVANMSPQKVFEQLKTYIKQIAPKEVTTEVQHVHSGDWALVNVNSPAFKAAVESLKETFGTEPVLSRSGGSIPIVALFQKNLEVDPILIGYGLPDDGLHSPNEKFDLEQFYKGIECNISLYKKLGVL